MSDTPISDKHRETVFALYSQGLSSLEVVPARRVESVERKLAAMTATKDRLRDALHQLDTMCREDSRFMVSSDGRVHDMVERVLAEVTP